MYDTVLTHGSARFTDAPVQATHPLRALELAVPFISSLPSQRQVRVQPLLAYTLDGSRFESAAVATPFSERCEGTLSLSLKQLDISRGLGSVPRGLPVALRSALLSREPNIALEQRPKLSLRVSGTVDAGGLALADAAAAPLLEGWPHPWGDRRVAAARRDGQARPPRSRSAAGPRGLTRPRLPCAACARSAARPSARPAQRRRRWPHSAATRPGPRRMPTR